jgi:hypothetical protein
MLQSMEVLISSESNEWYTPPEYIEAVKKVLGKIGLDPASHPIPQRWIQADRYFTESDDGLSQVWECDTLFLNPPYGKTRNRSNQGIWANCLVDTMRYGCVKAGAIMLTKTVPGYDWWDDLFNGLWDGPVCITRGRIPFIKPEWVTIKPHGWYNITIPKSRITSRGKEVHADWRSKAASCFWYWGKRPELFERVFSKIGRVIMPDSWMVI